MEIMLIKLQQSIIAKTFILFVLCLNFLLATADLQDEDVNAPEQQNQKQQQQQREAEAEDVIILVPQGEDPNTAKERVVIPQAKNGHQIPLPCLVADTGVFEHGQTFTKQNFHYSCRNGTAEVIACVADDMSVIQIGRTFLRNGMRHRCEVHGNLVTYEQRSTCYENGVHYDIGEMFKNGSFQLVCKENGAAVLGCFLMNSTSEKVILLGESRIVGNKKHSCEVTNAGKIRYTIALLGCHNEAEAFEPGQIWSDQHIRYQCTPDGSTRVLGCINENGLFIELGHDILMGGTVHRCYIVNNVAYYHRFQCEKERFLTECIHSNYVPKQQQNAQRKRRRRSRRALKNN